MEMTTCILGATGSIGVELTAALLRNNENVIAVVRDETKLQELLKSRGVASVDGSLTVVRADLFSEDRESGLKEAIEKSDYVFNCASPKISWVPFSETNRNWGEPVSGLTKKVVELAEESKRRPHVFAFCGPEYFEKHDGSSGFLGGVLSAILKSLIGALRDNSIEAGFLLNTDYEKWTVLRCGSVRAWAGVKGDASKIDVDFHKDRSNYRQGKGNSLIAEDLGAFVADLIGCGKMPSLNNRMPFVFNTRF